MRPNSKPSKNFEDRRTTLIPPYDFPSMLDQLFIRLLKHAEPSYLAPDDAIDTGGEPTSYIFPSARQRRSKQER